MNYHNNNWSALMGAAFSGHLAVVERLIAANADVNFQTPRSYPGHVHSHTALMAAAEHGHCDVVARLVAANADVNLRNSLGRTALKRAEYVVKEGLQVPQACFDILRAARKGWW